ncbi:hypothetical protein DF19_16655 [Streptomyces olindensis]|nr:hypothetical protein DF19_16655 [Streptomyces olindensis]
MSGPTEHAGRGVGASGGRRTRPWAELRGTSDEANALARLLREWLDRAGLRLDDLLRELKAEHFERQTIPSRSTVADRLAGVNPRWDFVEAVADVCSRNKAERDRLTERARPLYDAAERARRAGRRGGRPASPPEAVTGPGHGGAEATAELVAAQQHSLALSDQLLRALQRTAELEKARNDANQMVLILLALVDKLHRDIATLTAERDRTMSRLPGLVMLDEVQDRLRHSEAQRVQAETELSRARAEREKADRLAEQSAEQVRRLSEELARLRRGDDDGSAAGEDAVPEPDALVPSPVPGLVQDDIDAALTKAAHILDNGAERLEQLAEELQDESAGLSGPDNPLTSGARPDNRPDNPPDHASDDGPEYVPGHGSDHGPDYGSDISVVVDYADNRAVAQLVDKVRWAQASGRDDGLIDLLCLAGRDWPAGRLLAALKRLRRLSAGPEVARVFREFGERRPTHGLVSALPLLPRDDVRAVIAAMGAGRPARPFLHAVERLRAVGLSDFAGQALLAAGRLRPLDKLPLVLPPLRGGREADTVLILHGVCARPPEEREAAVSALAEVGMREEAGFLRVAAAGSGSTSSWFDPTVRARREPEPQEPERRTSTTLTTRIRINIPGSRPIPPVVVRGPQVPSDRAPQD